MKSKSNNVMIKFCVENIWIASYTLLIGMFLDRAVFSSQFADIASIVLMSLGAIVSVIGLAFGRGKSKAEQKAENDERAQMILQKAAKWTALSTFCICILIAFACLSLDHPYTGLLVLSIALFSQLLMQILKAVFARKY